MSLPKTAAWQTCRYCEKQAVGVYVTGLCCANHTPAASAGRPEPPAPDPDRTAVGLVEVWGKLMERRREDAQRRRAGLRVFPRPSGPGGRYTSADIDYGRVHDITGRLGREHRERLAEAAGGAL